MRRLLLGLAGTLIAGTLSLTPSAAHAETTLCEGRSFDETKKCDPGWAVNMMFMHWRMYRGHNCTNYVAWRLTRDGVQQPSYLLGSARSWARRAENHGVPVNSTPQVGSVGTWSGRNHIVYVEQIGPGWMLLSEDSWSAKRYRRYIAHKGDRGYPTKFIHFAGKNAIRGATPTVTGTPLVGQTLVAKIGTWSPKGVKLTQRWLRDGVVIPRATGTTYRLTSADAGKAISISVTGTFPGRLARTASSMPTKPVSAGAITPATPQITGVPVAGTHLVAVPGTWRPANVQLSYQWYAAGKKIKGADERTWKVGKKRKGLTITVRVTGAGPGFEPVTAESAPTLPVVKKGETVGPISAGAVRINETPTMVVGDKLTADLGTWGPGTVRRTVRWLRDGELIPGVTWTSYRLTAADIGKRLSVAVTGSRASFTSTRVVSPESSVVHPRKLRPTTPPSITGSGLVGETLQFVPGVWLPGGTQSSVQWTRDGAAIPGATKPSYQVTNADLQKRLAAKVITKLAGWPTDARTVTSTVRVRTVPVITVRYERTQREHTRRIRLGAKAIGRTVGGKIFVFRAGKGLKTLSFANGTSAVYEYPAKPGTYTLTLRYIGPDWLTPVTRDLTVEVK